MNRTQAERRHHRLTLTPSELDELQEELFGYGSEHLGMTVAEAEKYAQTFAAEYRSRLELSRNERAKREREWGE